MSIYGVKGYGNRSVIKPLPDDKILDWSKLKAFAEEKSNVTKKIISVFDRVENIVEKGEIARYEQFLLFPQCFRKACFPGASKGVILWEWVKSFYKKKTIKVFQNLLYRGIS